MVTKAMKMRKIPCESNLTPTFLRELIADGFMKDELGFQGRANHLVELDSVISPGKLIQSNY